MPTVPDLDLARIRQFLDSRVPPHLRAEARIEADVRKSVTIFDCRPPWHPNLTDWSRVPIAQLRYDPDTTTWALYWADRNSRWHRYDDPDPGTVDQLLNEIDDDLHLLGLTYHHLAGDHFSTTPRDVNSVIGRMKTEVRPAMASACHDDAKYALI